MKMKRDTNYGLVGLVVMLAVVVVGIGGWVANIVKLAGSTFDPITGELVLRVIGIFIPPIGMIMGFL
jgi:hypothetical protein